LAVGNQILIDYWNWNTFCFPKDTIDQRIIHKARMISL